MLIMLLIIVTGCSDDEPDSPNYTPVPPTSGNIVFWSSYLPTHDGRVKIVIEGKESFITVNYFSEPPSCVSNIGNAFFNLSGGTYTYTASSVNHGTFQTGTVTVVNGECRKKNID